MDIQNQQSSAYSSNKEIPVPPISQAKIRTMRSDLQSLGQSGGQEPKPYFIEINQAPKKAAPTEKKSATEKPTNEKTIFPKWLSIVILLLILTTLIGAGIYLLFFRSPSAQNSTGQQLLSEPSAAPATISPIIPQQPKIPRQSPSFFKKPFFSREEIILNPLTADNLRQSLLNAASGTAIGTLKEIIFQDKSFAPIPFSQLFSLLSPESNAKPITTIFEDNFGAAIFIDKNGAWPGYAVQTKPNASLIQAYSLIKEAFETPSFAPNFFLKKTATATASFQDNKIGNPAINARCLAFNQNGANFCYGWQNNNLLLIATSTSTFSMLLDNL